MRKWLIITGIPLAALNLGFGLWFGGVYAALAVLGMSIAFQVAALVDGKGE